MSQTATRASGSTGKNIVIAVLVLLVLGLLVLLMIDPAGGDSAEPASESTAPAAPEDAVTDAPAQPESSQAPEPDPEYEAFLLSLPDRVEGDPMALGDVDAPVVMIQWADFQCGYCQRFAVETAPQFQPYLDSGQLRIEYRDVALFGEESIMVAAAARAAGFEDLFWEYHDLAYTSLSEGEGPITDELLAGWADQVGVADLAQWQARYVADETRQAVAVSSLAAQEIGVNSTPTFVVGTQVVMGAQPFEYFRDVIETELSLLS